MSVDLAPPALSDNEFHALSRLLYRTCGITLQEGKQGLVKARLMKRLRALHLENFSQYLTYLAEDKSGQELVQMMDVLTTNKTSFFREPQHFDYLRRQVLPGLLAQPGPLRLWSAGCSSGEEPFSLALLLCQQLADGAARDVRILATDLSPTVLAVARRAEYTAAALKEVPEALVRTYFTHVPQASGDMYRVNDKVQALVRFARLNLMAPWPMRGLFHVIFCRNVMIYFDKPTQQRLVQRFGDLLIPGGHLFVGHAESLAGASHQLRYVQPAVYIKGQEEPTP